MDSVFPITLLYTGVLGLMMSVLSIRVPIRRGVLDAPVGDGGDEELAKRIRVFGNFIEYVPAILVAMLVLEASGASDIALHGFGSGLIGARIVHALMLRARSNLTAAEKAGRAVGAMGTWMVLTGAAGYALWLALRPMLS